MVRAVIWSLSPTDVNAIEDSKNVIDREGQLGKKKGIVPLKETKKQSATGIILY